MSDTEWEPGDPLYPDQRPHHICPDCSMRWAYRVRLCPQCGARNPWGPRLDDDD